MAHFKNCKITNFRGIKKLNLNKLTKFNILLGKNNTGKSTVLEALYVLLNLENPALLPKTNIFRNIDVISTDYNNFDLKNTIELESSISDQSTRKLKISTFSPEVESMALNLNKPGSPDITSANAQHRGIEYKFTIESNPKKITKHKATALLPDLQEMSKKLQEGKPIEQIIIDVKKDKKYQEILGGAFINSKTYSNNKEITDNFAKVSKNNQEHLIVGILQEIEKTIENMNVSGEHRIEVKDNRFPQTKVSLNSYGDGLFRIASILTTSINNQGKIILIDEIENGLDADSQSILWKALFLYGLKYDIQVVTATHSLEMVKNFYQEAKSQDLLKDINVTRIERKADEHSAVQMNADDIKYFIEQNWDLR